MSCKKFKIKCLTSIGLDALDVLFSFVRLDGGSLDQIFIPATDVVIEIYDAEIVIHRQIVQNSLHRLHCLQNKKGC